MLTQGCPNHAEFVPGASSHFYPVVHSAIKGRILVNSMRGEKSGTCNAVSTPPKERCNKIAGGLGGTILRVGRASTHCQPACGGELIQQLNCLSGKVQDVGGGVGGGGLHNHGRVCELQEERF